MSALCQQRSLGRRAPTRFADRDLWNIDPAANEPHSALMLRARITLPHFSVSSAMNFPKAADVIDIGSTPKPASRAFMRGSAAMALISLLSLSITPAGVSFGAPTPPSNHISIFFSRGRRDELHREKCNHYRRILASSVPNYTQLRLVIVPWSTLYRARLGA